MDPKGSQRVPKWCKGIQNGAKRRPKSADLRFGVLEHVVGETRGEVYLPPTPLRPGAGHRRATNSSEGLVEEAKPLGRVG